MVSVKCLNCSDYYMDNKLHRELSAEKLMVNEKDEDRFWVVDGAEGVGKSVLALQLAFFVDSSFNLSRVVFDPIEFKRAVMSAKKGQAIVFDEAFTGLSSRASLSKINNLLVSLMMEMRQKNLFVFIVLPNIFMLDKYVAIHRSCGLFHVYRNSENKRGFWIYFNRRKKRLLYENGKASFTYSGKNIPKSSFRGRFYDKYVIDEKEYRRRKRDALEKRSMIGEDSNYIEQRNALLWLIYDEFKVSSRKMKPLLLKYGVNLSANAVLYAVNKAKDAFSN